MYEPFTWNAYAECLDAALASGYKCVSFAGLTDKSRLPDYRFVLLRHDVDYDPNHVPPICRLEAERGIQGTYCFQADSPFYRIESEETLGVVREVLSCGHWLGLHFDANRIYDDSEVVRRVEQAAREIEGRCGSPVSAVSFHMPTYRNVGHLELENGRVNTYSALFFNEVTYISDSNQNVRVKGILELFREGVVSRVQLLTHPIWWREKYTPFFAKIEELAAKLRIPISDILTAEQLALINGKSGG